MLGATVGRCACGGGCPSCLAAADQGPSLEVGALDDPAEVEAARLAATIAPPGDEVAATEDLGATDAASPLPAGGSTPAAAADLALMGGGRPLDDATRADMEPRLGTDLRHVRIHTGPAAAHAAASIGAKAYTHGSDIVFGADQYAPGTPTGRHTIAHELAHVAQRERHAPAVRRQSTDPRHARGYSGEQDMGFVHYSTKDGWVLFDGPSGAKGHGTTQSGFDAVAYNTRTGEVHLVDNKSLARSGNVGSATAIDPSRNLAKNVDDLITKVEAASNTEGRIALLARLRALRAALAAGKPLPKGIRLVVTGMGGRSTGVTPRLAAQGVEFHDPPTKTPLTPSPKGPAIPSAVEPPLTPVATAVPKSTPEPLAPPAVTPKPITTPAPVASPVSTPVEPVGEVIPVPGGKVPMPPAKAPSTTPPVATPPVRPTGRWQAGLKAGGKALLWMVVFAGLDYWVHKKLQEQLEASIDMAHKGAMPWAQHLKRDDPTKPVYMRVTVEAQEYSTYVLFLGWMPDPPVLHMVSMAMVREPIDPPQITEIDNRLDIFHPGMTTRVVYTELMVE